MDLAEDKPEPDVAPLPAPAPQAAPAVRSRGGALVSGAVALLLFCAFGGVVELDNLATGAFRMYGRGWRTRFSLEEAILLAAIVFLAAPATVLAARAASASLGPLLGRLLQAARRRSRWVVAACAAGALAASAGAGTVLVRHSPLTDDEQVQIFQAQLLEGGRLAAPEPKSLKGIEPPGVWVRDGEWTARGQWGQAAVLAAGRFLGSPFIFMHLAAPALILLTWLLGRELFRADRAARLGAVVVLATSPFLLFTTASLNAANTSAVATLAGAVALTRHVRRGGMVWAFLAGVAFGVGFHVRPINAAALGGVAAGLAVAARLADRRSVLPTLAGLILGLLPAAAAHYALAQHGFTTYVPILGALPSFDTFGGVAADALRILLWTTGSALTGVVVLAAAAGATRRATDWLLLLPAGALLLVFTTWERPPESDTGPAAYLDALPFLALFLGRAFAAAHARLSLAGRRALATGAAATMAVALVTWWPIQALALRNVATVVSQPYTYPAEVNLPKSLVLWHAPEPARSWVTMPRPPAPDGNETYIYLRARAADWLTARIGNRRHLDGRRIFQTLQNWDTFALYGWQPEAPYQEEEWLSRPQLTCDLPPPNQVQSKVDRY